MVRFARSRSFNPHRPRRSGAIQRLGFLFELAQDLSILTAPEGAVQSDDATVQFGEDDDFQSSPPPKERCNVHLQRIGNGRL